MEESKKTIKKLNKLREETKKIIKGRDNLLDALILGLASNEHILIKGPTGEAKSLAAEIISKSTGMTYFYQQLHQETRIRDIVGVFNPFPFSKPELFVDPDQIRGNPDKMKELYNHLLMKTDIWDANIVYFDEIMRGRSEFVDFLLEVMQERRISKTILPAEDIPVISVIATTNPLTEDYNTERLDAAVKDRFYSIINMNHLIEEDESAVREVMQLEDEGNLIEQVDEVDIDPEELIDLKKTAIREVDYNSNMLLQLFRNLKELGYPFSTRFHKKYREVLQVNALMNNRDRVKDEDLFKVSYLMLQNRFSGLDKKDIEEVANSALISSEYSPLINELEELEKTGEDMKYISKGLTLIERTDKKYPALPDKLQERLSEKEDKVKQKVRSNIDNIDPLLIRGMDSQKFADVRKTYLENNTLRTKILDEQDRKNVRDIINDVTDKANVSAKEDDETGGIRYIVKPLLSEPKSFKEINVLENKLEDHLQMF